MAELATVSTKGQFVIPADIREARIAVLREGNRIILEPVNKEYVRALRGALAGGPSMTDELLKDRREENRRSKW
jgi:bifunctional DNA-binding transcriptional regulator/antitoxin component of YhaV-PrlF toxin-antitoxin module